VPVDEGFEAGDVEAPILEHRGDYGDQAALDHGLTPLMEWRILAGFGRFRHRF
jgi:hypothetical protein